MEKITSSALTMILMSVTLGSFGQIFLKLGMRAQKEAAAQGTAAVAGAIKSLGCPQVLLGFALYGISSIIWLIIIKRVNLSLAYPMISLSYVFVAILSSVILKERIAVSTIAGILMICSGVALIGFGSNVGGK